MAPIPRLWPPWADLVVLAILGALIGVMPHVASLARTGSPTYIATGDELLYLSWSQAAVLDGHPWLVDGVHSRSGPVMHPEAVFLPPALLAHALGMGMDRVGILWRALGGMTVALGLYMALRQGLASRAAALGAAVFLFFNPGFLVATPVRYDLLDLLRLLGVVSVREGGEFAALRHLRVLTPALVLPVFLIHLGLMTRARDGGPGARRAAWGAAIAFGAMFYSYFYFWTAALGACVLAAIIDRRSWRLYAQVALAGLILGLPAIVQGYRIKAETAGDWLLRTSHFLRVGHTTGLHVPRVTIAIWGLISVYILRRRTDLIYLWCMAGVGLALMNHRLITGMDIEDFHWINAVGPPMALLAVFLIVPPTLRRPWGRAVLLTALAVQVTIGLVARMAESEWNPESVALRETIRRRAADDLPIPRGAVLGGEFSIALDPPPRTAVEAALDGANTLSGRLVEYSASATDEELDERLMLNLYLSGLTTDEARRLVDRPPGTLSRESSAVASAIVARLQRERRLALIETIWRDPVPFLRRFDVTHVIRPTEDRAETRTSLAALGRPVKAGPYATLWAINGAGSGEVNPQGTGAESGTGEDGLSGRASSRERASPASSPGSAASHE